MIPSVVARGHPPGPVLLLWALMRIGVTDRIGLALLLTAVGAAAVPLVLFAVRGVCGDQAARRYLPVLALAPYAVWLAVGVEGVVALLGAAMIAAGVHASDERRTGIRAGIWAGVAGSAARRRGPLFSYGAPWLGLAAAFLYFARRRRGPQPVHRPRRADPAGRRRTAGLQLVRRADGRRATTSRYGSNRTGRCSGGAGSAWSCCCSRPDRRCMPACASRATRRAGRSWSAPASRCCSPCSPAWPGAARRRPGCRSSPG